MPSDSRFPLYQEGDPEPKNERCPNATWAEVADPCAHVCTGCLKCVACCEASQPKPGDDLGECPSHPGEFGDH